MVRAVGVIRSFDTGKVTVGALRGADLEIRRGEMVAIMGPSGCGSPQAEEPISPRLTGETFAKIPSGIAGTNRL